MICDEIGSMVAAFNRNIGYKVMFQRAFGLSRIPMIRIAWQNKLRYMKDQLQGLIRRVAFLTDGWLG